MVLNDAGVIGLTLNGKSFPATAPIVANEGDWIQVTYYNEGLQVHPMHLHGFEQIVIAKDGEPLDHPYAADTILVGPGRALHRALPRHRRPGRGSGTATSSTTSSRRRACSAWSPRSSSRRPPERRRGEADDLHAALPGVPVARLLPHRRRDHRAGGRGRSPAGRRRLPRRGGCTGLTIERVIETHVHADFLSGHLELAARTGAVISYGDGAAVEFPIELLDDGQRLSLGGGHPRDPGHAGAHAGVDLRRRLRARRRRRSRRRAHRRHAVRRRRRPPRSAGRGRSRALRRDAGPPAVPLAARQAPACCPTTRLSGPRRRLVVRQATVLGDQLDDRRAARTNYALAADDRGRLRRRRDRGPARAPQYFEFDAQRNRELRPLLDEEPPVPIDVDGDGAAGRQGRSCSTAREPSDFAAGTCAAPSTSGSGSLRRMGRRRAVAAARHRARRRSGRAPPRPRCAWRGSATTVSSDSSTTRRGVRRPARGSSRAPADDRAARRSLARPDLQLVDVRGPRRAGRRDPPGALEIPLAA